MHDHIQARTAMRLIALNMITFGYAATDTTAETKDWVRESSSSLRLMTPFV